MTGSERIVCLTEEAIETPYLLGEGERIGGITGYAVRPPQAQREKQKVTPRACNPPSSLTDRAPRR
jgi:iron complex transport system substrate-binding protein